jgi:5-methylcytosine-specific restriction enzyme subunit McrC
MDPSPIVSVDALRPEVPGQRRPFEVVVTVPREDGGEPPVDIGPAVFDHDKTRDLIPSFGTFYARHLEKALARGIPRAYQEIQERVPGIRGRVDLPGQMRLAGLPLPAECRFDDFTADIRLNRILRAAAGRLLRLPRVTVPTRLSLQRLAAALGESRSLMPGDLRTPTVFNRLNEHCRPAEHLARLARGNETLLNAVGGASAGVFLVDMSQWPAVPAPMRSSMSHFDHLLSSAYLGEAHAAA